RTGWARVPPGGTAPLPPPGPALRIRRSDQPHRGLLGIAGDVLPDDQHRYRAVDFGCAVQYPKRLVDPAGREVVIHGQRFASQSVLVGPRMIALSDRDLPQILAGGALLMLMATGPHREPLRRH